MNALVAIAIFVGFGLFFVLFNLILSMVVRPKLAHPVKESIYECGEPAAGSAWVQFDLRFYIVALFYLVFDVEVALLYPWAVVYREIPTQALVLGLPFLLIVVVGFIYEWFSGSLDWVRSELNTSNVPAPRSDAEMAKLARIDPEILENQTSTPSA
ncbi:MAG: NADH-quinone oxidoreductase subunit A [Phycisphaerales bacterium]|nr:NADH-quinone oxidoreductase subunit A [Phycisphaerales bacterium]